MKRLNEIERKIWISFHEYAYKEDLSLAESLISNYPRWSIISGYYAMHDITKLYLGKIHNIKISGQNIHKQTISALRKVLPTDPNTEEILELLKNAEEKIKELGIEDISYLLQLGKSERGKVQYYSKESFSESRQYEEKARTFFNDIVKIFIKIIEAMTNVS